MIGWIKIVALLLAGVCVTWVSIADRYGTRFNPNVPEFVRIVDTVALLWFLVYVVWGAVKLVWR